ncbi:MAG: hypothetical protein V2I54_14585 [Bacteroidales bacterium]|jgi:hypothetical protein|nr:hypothetical protein [Bacteroidales bacterium]
MVSFQNNYKLEFTLKLVLFIIFFFSNFSLLAQRKGEITFCSVPYEVIGQDNPDGYIEKEFFFGSSFDYAVYEFSNILKENLNNKEKQRQFEIAKQQSKAKLEIIKKQYSSYENYPEKITNGWHSAIATDNFNFCKDVKVYVEDNRIKRFVIDNYIPLNFMTTGEIRDAKNVVTLKNFNGEQLNIVEVYFLYDIEQSRVVPEPIKPAYVCFWTDLKNYHDILLDFNNQRMERFSVRFENMPECFSKGMICRILKPGTYSYIARGKGAINWTDTFEAKENVCLSIRLGR